MTDREKIDTTRKIILLTKKLAVDSGRSITDIARELNNGSDSNFIDTVLMQGMLLIAEVKGIELEEVMDLIVQELDDRDAALDECQQPIAEDTNSASPNETKVTPDCFDKII